MKLVLPPEELLVVFRKSTKMLDFVNSVLSMFLGIAPFHLEYVLLSFHDVIPKKPGIIAWHVFRKNVHRSEDGCITIVHRSSVGCISVVIIAGHELSTFIKFL